MAVADFLEKVGEGAKAIGSVAQPILERTAQVVSGQAPQIDAEQRQQQTKMEDAAIETKAKALQDQLAMGQKYGTLTPEQSQQYVDQITQLYSHPSQSGKLMEKLRQAIHPTGAVATPNALSTLKSAVPAGGTAETDARIAAEKRGVHALPGVKPFKGPDGRYYQPVMDAQGTISNQAIEGYTPPPASHGGKSPPLTGDKLPDDAVGPSGEPIPPEERTVGKSFVEFGGHWWPVAKPKPVFKTLKGHSVLVDSQTGAVMRDLGPTGSVKVTKRQSLQPGDDGQMHLVTLTTVMGPAGENIDVQPDEAESPTQGTESKPAGKGIGGIIKPQAKPVTKAPGGLSAGKVVPGLSSLAHHKIQTAQDKQQLESSKQIISAVDDLMPILEARKNEGGLWDAGKAQANFAAYKMGLPTADPQDVKIFENAALLNVIGASIWSRLGRSKYTFEAIRQHLPNPTDTPKLMYDKVKWLKENVVPAAQEAVTNPQPDDSGAPPAQTGDAAVDEFLKKF